LKTLYKNSSNKKGNFPRIYSYKGVILTWEDIFSITNTSSSIFHYYSAYDNQNDTDLSVKINLEILKINKENGNLQYKYLLDNVDYTED
jgi:hypothetical protein